MVLRHYIYSVWQAIMTFSFSSVSILNLWTHYINLYFSHMHFFCEVFLNDKKWLEIVWRKWIVKEKLHHCQNLKLTNVTIDWSVWMPSYGSFANIRPKDMSIEELRSILFYNKKVCVRSIKVWITISKDILWVPYTFIVITKKKWVYFLTFWINDNWEIMKYVKCLI